MMHAIVVMWLEHVNGHPSCCYSDQDPVPILCGFSVPAPSDKDPMLIMCELWVLAPSDKDPVPIHTEVWTNCIKCCTKRQLLECGPHTYLNPDQHLALFQE